MEIKFTSHNVDVRQFALMFTTEWRTRRACTASGWEVTEAMPLTLWPRTTRIRSPPWTRTMTRHRDVALAPPHMGEDGGFTGEDT